jgi:hypothetical protein
MKQALQALIDEMEYVLSCINEDKIPFDGDDFHAALRLGKEALANQEEPLPPVEIGVDVTSDGASVVAFYRRQNAVMEMFYSQFHPLAKQEQGEPVAYLVYDTGACSQYLAFDDELGDMDGCTIEPLYTTPHRTWVGLNWSDLPNEWVGKPAFMEGAKWADGKLKEKNT